MQFITTEIHGPEFSVRRYFQARSIEEAATNTLFPGISNVAILPRHFSSVAAANEWLEAHTQQGGNAAAVQIAAEHWVVGGWIE